MANSDNKAVYLKLQGAANYQTWKQNMISLFKKELAYNIATGKTLKPPQPAYPNNLDTLEFEDQYRAFKITHTAITVTTAVSQISIIIIVISQSGQFNTILSPIPEISQDEFNKAYKAYLRKWEIYEK